MVTQNPETVRFIAYLLVLFSDMVAFLYSLLKIYRILCYSKITFDQLPILNPYKWPFSFFRVITKPYFKFWSNCIPSLKLGKVSYDVSSIVGLEMLSSLIYLSLQLRTMSFLEAQRILTEV